MLFIPALLLLLFASPRVSAEPIAEIDPKSRCQVCGMFVAKYPDWITQVLLQDGSPLFFDGVKDLMVYFFNPVPEGTQRIAIKEIWVKDYYTLDWIAAEKAFYVAGSDVHGPMGHELIPFSSLAGAENFRKDHQGKQVLSFTSITEPLIDSLRSGQRMR